MARTEEPQIIAQAPNMERIRYRAYEFEIEKTFITWWCHGGIRVPFNRDDYLFRGMSLFGDYEPVWDLCGIGHEAGWASRSRRSIVRKLCRAVDKDIEQKVRRRILESSIP